MSRIAWVLVALIALLLGALWYFVIYSPTSEEIEAVREDTMRIESEAASQREYAEELRQVRLQAPEAESELAFGRTLIPDDPAIPSLFRQIQQAADDSGARLVTLTPGSPGTTTAEGEEIAAIPVSMTLQASYFQIVDFARRIEDPLLTPRALRWGSATLSPSEFPELNVSLSGQVYSRDVPEVDFEDEAPPEVAPTDEEGDEVDEFDELDQLEGGDG